MDNEECRPKGNLYITEMEVLIVKSTYFIFVIIISVCLPMFLFSDSEGNEHGKSVELILKEIREEQGIELNESINLDKVSPELLEELGEAVMSIMHPDPKQHEWMDTMMGGEGSARLRAMHQTMGYQYLTGESGPIMGRGIAPCRGGALFNRRGKMGHGMMGYPFSYGGRWGFGMMNLRYGGMIVMWVIVIVLIGLVVYLIVRSQRPKESGGILRSGETPIDIIKRRYASGEINREEYERLQKDLK